jgi:hypothetical protein
MIIYLLIFAAGWLVGSLTAAVLAATRVHILTGRVEHWQRTAQRYALAVHEDIAAEEG